MLKNISQEYFEVWADEQSQKLIAKRPHSFFYYDYNNTYNYSYKSSQQKTSSCLNGRLSNKTFKT